MKLAQPRTLVILVAVAGLFVCGGGIWALQAPGTGPRDTTWSRIHQQGFMIIGVDVNYPPFGIHDPAGPRGLDPALGQVLADHLGVEARFALLGFDGIYDSLFTGEVDVVIAALRPDPLRQDQVFYTDPYFDAGLVFVGRSDPPVDFVGIDGSTLAVEYASEAHVLAEEKLPMVLPLLSIEAAIQAVLAGDADYALVDSISARLLALPDLHMASATVVPDPYVVAVRRTDWRLYDGLQQALDAVRNSGQLDDLVAQWLQPTASE